MPKLPVITHTEDIIRTSLFKGAHVKNKLDTIEGQIVHDADKLDAIGTMGIGRAFAYGGANGRPMHDPKHTDELHISFEHIKTVTAPPSVTFTKATAA